MDDRPGPRHRPGTDEAEDRVRHLHAHGPSRYAFTLRESFPPPGEPGPGQPIPDRDEWLCPA